MSDKRHYLPALTGFRAVAAWLLFAHHYNPFRPGLFISDLVNETYIGVSLFFVLSGFLITTRYDEPRSFRGYIQNRFARIYPLYFILTTLTFVVAGSWDTWTYISNITFLRGFFEDLKFTGISQGWSLTVEEMFYFLAPVIFLLIRKNRVAWMLPLFFVVVGVAIYKPMGSLNFMLVYTFFGRSFDFFAGIMLAKIYKHTAQSTSSKQLLTWAGVVLLVSCCFLLAAVRGEAKYAVLTIPGLFIHHLLVPVSTALLLFGLLTERSWLRRLLSTDGMQLLGKSSYALYLIHIGIIAAWLSNELTANPLVLFVVLNAIALGLYYVVEKPLQKTLSADV